MSFKRSKMIENGVWTFDEDEGESEPRGKDILRMAPAGAGIQPLKRKNVQRSAAGDEISLKDLPGHTLPSDFTGDGYAPYIVNLTEAGSREAEALTGKIKFSMCLVCVDKGKPLSQCLFADTLGLGKAGGNPSRHHKIHIKGGDINAKNNRTMVRITELKGSTLGPAVHHEVSKGGDDEIGVEKTTSTSQVDLEDSILNLIHAYGLPYDIVASGEFRKVLNTATELEESSLVRIGAGRIKSKTLERFAEYRDKLIATFATFAYPRVHIQYDCWELRGSKYLGTSVSYIEDDGKDIRRIVAPIGFKQLHNDWQPSTIPLADESTLVRMAITKEVTMYGLEKDRIASLTSANASNAVSCKFMEFHSANYGYKSFIPSSAHDRYGDSQSDLVQSSITNAIALAATYAIGMKKAALVHSETPPGPSKVIDDAIHAARQQCIALRTQQLVSAASRARRKDVTGKVKFFKPALEDASRWWSTAKMLRSTILNRNVVEVLAEPHLAIAPETFGLIQEVYAIIQPLADLAMTLSETSTTKPIGPATLPLIVLVLIRYGVSMKDKEGLYFEHPPELKTANYGTEISFDVLQCDGQTKRKELKSFSVGAREFFKGWVKHLTYQLVTQRRNKFFFFEVLGMLIDPVMKSFAPIVLPSDNHSGEWTAVESQRWCIRAMETIRSHSSSSEAKGLDRIIQSGPKRVRLVGNNDACLAELTAFQSELHPVFAGYVDDDNVPSVCLEDFCEILTKYDPIAFWSSSNYSNADQVPPPRVRFPTLFQLNIVTLAYMPSSAFQERMFSSARRVFNESRLASRLTDELAEASVLLHVHAASNRQVRIDYSKANDEE